MKTVHSGLYLFKFIGGLLKVLIPLSPGLLMGSIALSSPRSPRERTAASLTPQSSSSRALYKGFDGPSLSPSSPRDLAATFLTPQSSSSRASMKWSVTRGVAYPFKGECGVSPHITFTGVHHIDKSLQGYLPKSSESFSRPEPHRMAFIIKKVYK